MLGAAQWEGAGERDKPVTSGTGRVELTLETWYIQDSESMRNSSLNRVRRPALEEHTAGSQRPAQGEWVWKLNNPLHIRGLPSARLALVGENQLQQPSWAPLMHA